MSRTALWRILAIAMPVVAAIAAPMPTADLGYLLRAGSEMFASGTIATTESWTFTAAGTPWLNQEWGAEALLHLVFAAAGWTGLVLFRAALVGVAYGLLLATLRRRAPRLGPIATTLLVIAVFVVSADALALRAQLFAIILFGATLYVLAIRAQRPRAVWLIPVFAMAWANVHGTFPFAPALCGLAWLADLYDGLPGTAAGTGWRRGLGIHRMLAVGMVAVLATFVTPSGPGVWGYVVSLTSSPTIPSRVSEWQPPSPLTVHGAIVWLSVVAVATLALARVRAAWRRRDTTARSDRRPGAFRSTVVLPWPALLTLALFGGLALVSGRGTTWWPFVAAFVIAPWLAPAGPTTAAAMPPPRSTPPLLRRLNLAIVAALALAGVALLPIWRPVGPAGVPSGTLAQAPQGIARFVMGVTCPQSDGVHWWNPQVWGSWLEFAAPCHKYAVDSRIELFTAQAWDDAAIVETGAPGWEAIVREAGVTAVIVERAGNEAFERAAHSADGVWSRVFADCDGSIWAWIGPHGYRGPVPQDAPVPACD